MTTLKSREISRFGTLFTKQLTNTTYKKPKQTCDSVATLMAVSRVKGGFTKLYLCALKINFKRTGKDKNAQSKCSKDKQDSAILKTDLKKKNTSFCS